MSFNLETDPYLQSFIEMAVAELNEYMGVCWLVVCLQFVGAKVRAVAESQI